MLHCRASLLPINSQNFHCEYNLRLLASTIRYDNSLRLSTTFIIYDNSLMLIIAESSYEAEYIVIVFDAYASGRCSNLLALQANCQKPIYVMYALRNFVGISQRLSSLNSSKNIGKLFYYCRIGYAIINQQ